MSTFVSDYWLYVVVTWARHFLDFFESVGFTYCSFCFFCLFDVIITNSGHVFWHEIRTCWFRNSWTYSSLYTLFKLVSPNSWIISNDGCRLSPRNSILRGPLFFHLISSRPRIIHNFIVILICRFRNAGMEGTLFYISVSVILDNYICTSEGPGISYVTKIYLFCFPILNSALLLYFSSFELFWKYLL